ncbi:unnamed protein product [Nezara viridula]|uniref:Uncharacterized protein n=1 Tax=Nezara viridula TaxID=85310 RepID=A0A9P0MWC5_NEZVI|nr:unnamed protein product [Nezara viridula]
MAVNEKLLHTSIYGYYLAVLCRILMVGDLTGVSSNTFFDLYMRFNSRFLTKWTFIVILIYYSSMVLSHFLNLIFGESKSSYKLRRFADALFTTIVLPIGMYITIGFWIVYHIDRDLIFPIWLEEIIPGWVNHGVHTFNLVLPLIDLFLVKHTFPPWSEAVYYSALYCGSYTICLFGTYFQHGFWLYPIFEKMTLFQSICYCIVIYILVLVFHHIVKHAAIKFGISDMEIQQKEKNHCSKKVS